MIALTPAEIAAARADLATMLPDRCTIQRSVQASDGGGGQATTWADVAANVPCRLTPASASTGTGTGTATAGDRLNSTTTHVVTFAAGADIAQGDRIVIGADTYDTLAVGDGGAWELARHVEVRKAT